MPLAETYVEQLKVLERATQAEADRLQRKFVHKDRAHPYREKASLRIISSRARVLG